MANIIRIGSTSSSNYYDDSALKDVSATLSCSISGDELAIDQLTFTICTANSGMELFLTSLGNTINTADNLLFCSAENSIK